jgi:hypothetical protein
VKYKDKLPKEVSGLPVSAGLLGIILLFGASPPIAQAIHFRSHVSCPDDNLPPLFSGDALAGTVPRLNHSLNLTFTIPKKARVLSRFTEANQEKYTDGTRSFN